MKTKRTLTSLAITLSFLLASTSQAALIDRGSSLIYDTDLNITWLADANLAASNTFGVAGVTAGGYMNWFTAQNWISAMNTANYLGYNDWRLPTTLQPDATCSGQSGGDSSGYNCTGSEMGHLFYSELGGVANSDFESTHNSNYDLFINLQSDVYWSSTEQDPGSTNAWVFLYSIGYQFAASKYNPLFVEAVRTGDVTSVPVPAAAWLFSSGLIALIGSAKRKKTV